jgi:hypothetical protein
MYTINESKEVHPNPDDKKGSGKKGSKSKGREPSEYKEPEFPYYCKDCKQGYLNKASIFRHRKQVHEGEKWRCLQ